MGGWTGIVPIATRLESPSTERWQAGRPVRPQLRSFLQAALIAGM
jgi:hypothetical protein